MPLPVLAFLLVAIVLALAFRPELGFRYARIDLRKASMRVMVRQEDELVLDVTSDVAPGDVSSVLAILDRQDQPAPNLRERVRFWHVVCVVALVGSVVVLIVSDDDDNRQGAWAIIGTVVGVLVKPGESVSY